MAELSTGTMSVATAGVTASTAVQSLILALEIGLALPILYLFLLTLGAVVATWRERVTDEMTASQEDISPKTLKTFAIVVPAYNEELLIGATLSSLHQLDYPTDLYAVHVIADNCTDHTAEIARAAGAHVHERMDDARRGKGHALSWAIGYLMQSDAHYDAYVILDADTVVDPSLLRAFSRGLKRSGQALQAHYTVLNLTESSISALRWLALSLVNYIRPLGRSSWGGSSTLTGNGMCLARELLERHPWQAFGLSEDYQYYLALVSGGERVLFLPTAKVRSVMPTSARQLQSQDIRWETLDANSRGWQRHVLRQLFVDGILRRDWVRLDALAELITPPLSVLFAGGIALELSAFAFGTPVEILVASFLLGALLAYIFSPFLLLRPPIKVYGALLFGPAYIVRKLSIYFVLRHLRKHTSTWVRTARVASTGRDGAL